MCTGYGNLVQDLSGRRGGRPARFVCCVSTGTSADVDWGIGESLKPSFFRNRRNRRQDVRRGYYST